MATLTVLFGACECIRQLRYQYFGIQVLPGVHVYVASAVGSSATVLQGRLCSHGRVFLGAGCVHDCVMQSLLGAAVMHCKVMMMSTQRVEYYARQVSQLRLA